MFIHTAAVRLIHPIKTCTYLPNNYTINALNSICSLSPQFHSSICVGRHLSGMSDSVVLVFRRTHVLFMERALGTSALNNLQIEIDVGHIRCVCLCTPAMLPFRSW